MKPSVLNVSKQQLEKVIKAAGKGISITIRLKKNNLRGDQLSPLTQRQINRINKSTKGLVLTFSVAQLKHCKNLEDTKTQKQKQKQKQTVDYFCV